MRWRQSRLRVGALDGVVRLPGGCCIWHLAGAVSSLSEVPYRRSLPVSKQLADLAEAFPMHKATFCGLGYRSRSRKIAATCPTVGHHALTGRGLEAPLSPKPGLGVFSTQICPLR